MFLNIFIIIIWIYIIICILYAFTHLYDVFFFAVCSLLEQTCDSFLDNDFWE